MKRICIVSSGQPSANPRMVKEAVYLQQAGYEVTVIWCPLSSWADQFDKDLFIEHPDINWVQAGFHAKREKLKNYYARLLKKFFTIVYGFSGDVFDAGIRSVSLFSRELTNKAKKHKADLYIGHNPAALPAVVLAAKKNHSYCSFDFEDFHRGEFPKDNFEAKIYAKLEEQFVPQLDMATTASPLITAAYQKLFAAISFTTINNYFPKNYFPLQLADIPVMPLKLFWFSQAVGKNRGLEQVIIAMGKTGEEQIQLTLLGNCSADTKSYFDMIAADAGVKQEQIKYFLPVSEREIVTVAQQHHLGIAGEIAHTINRDICLTNKIFMYLGAGNAIVFSDTKAQTLFSATYPDSGLLYKQSDADSLSDVLLKYFHDRALLGRTRLNNLQLALNTLNMDQEKEVLLDCIGNKLNN